MLKRILFSAVIALYFTSMSVAADASCLQVVEASGEVEQICYTGAGMEKNEFEEQCKANNQESGFMKQTSEIVSECPAGHIGSCEMVSGPHSSAILYYRAENAEQLLQTCEMIGGKWKAVN